MTKPYENESVIEIKNFINLLDSILRRLKIEVKIVMGLKTTTMSVKVEAFNVSIQRTPYRYVDTLQMYVD